MHVPLGRPPPCHILCCNTTNFRVPIAIVGASNNHTCATCPTVAMGETRSLLLEHHSSDGIAVVGHLPIATEGYESLVRRRIVVVISFYSCTCWVPTISVFHVCNCHRSIACGVMVSFHCCVFESVRISLWENIIGIKYIILWYWLFCIHFLYGICVNVIPTHTYYEHSIWP
jgi:hypothetical protein